MTTIPQTKHRHITIERSAQAELRACYSCGSHPYILRTIQGGRMLTHKFFDDYEQAQKAYRAAVRKAKGVSA